MIDDCIGLSGFPDAVGEYTSSPIMEFEESFWSLRLYPGGYDQDSRDFLSCFVVCHSHRKTRASFRVTILNQKGWKNHSCASDGVKDFTIPSSVPHSSVLNVPNINNGIWGDPKFILRSMLKNSSNGMLCDDKLIVKLDLTIYGAVEHSSARYSDITSVVGLSPPSTNQKQVRCISDDLSALLFDESSADVSIITTGGCSDADEEVATASAQSEEGEDDWEGDGRGTVVYDNESTKASALSSSAATTIIPAHKFILSLRSPVFKAMFSVAMAEAVSNEVTIPDFEPVVVKEFLKFLYTDSCDPEELELHGEMLLAIACKYQVLGLEVLCENYLIASLTVNSVAGILRLADMYAADQLKLRALHFIKHHAKAVVQTEDFFRHLNLGLAQDVIITLAGVDSADNDGIMTIANVPLSPFSGGAFLQSNPSLSPPRDRAVSNAVDRGSVRANRDRSQSGLTAAYQPTLIFDGN